MEMSATKGETSVTERRESMKLVIIFGPPAVGKMTVGMELARLTGLRLFHNHVVVDVVLRYFEFGSPPFKRLVGEFRRRIFEEVAESDLPGLIFTFVWALDDPRDRGFIDTVCEIFRAQGAEIYFVELRATLDERLRRNDTELRLAEKWPKRDLKRSRELLLDAVEKYQLNSAGDFFYRDDGRYVDVDNTDLAPGDVAQRIVDAFGLTVRSADAAGGDDQPDSDHAGDVSRAS